MVGTGVGVGVGAGVGVAPTAVGLVLGVGVGDALGGSGGVGQPCSSGLNGVGLAIGVGTGVGVGVAVGVVFPLVVGFGVAVGTGVGVTTYGVYVGQGAADGMGVPWAAEIPREIATATAPTRMVTTKVTAPHSRRSAFKRHRWRRCSRRRSGTRGARVQAAHSSSAIRPAFRHRGARLRTPRPTPRRSRAAGRSRR